MRVFASARRNAQTKEIFATPLAYQVHRLTANGQTFYVYKNESADLALVGREAEYQRLPGNGRSGPAGGERRSGH